MTAIEIAQKVAAERQALLFRPREDGTYDVKELFTGKKKGWIVLDGWTASAIVAVYNGLNEVNKARYAALGITKMASIAFKLMK